MKDYDETIQSIFDKGDEILAARKKRGALIRRITFSASGICAAVIIGAGIWNSDLLRNGWKDNFGGDSFTADTVTTTTTVQTTTYTTATTEHTTSTEKTTTSETIASTASAQTSSASSAAKTTTASKAPATTTRSSLTSSSTRTTVTSTTDTPDITTTTTFNPNTGSPGSSGGGPALTDPPGGGANPDTTTTKIIVTTTARSSMPLPNGEDDDGDRYFKKITTFTTTLSYAPDVPVTYKAAEKFLSFPECDELYEIPYPYTDSSGETKLVTLRIFGFRRTSEEISVGVCFDNIPGMYRYVAVDYHPDDLGSLLDAYGLPENSGTVGLVYLRTRDGVTTGDRYKIPPSLFTDHLSSYRSCRNDLASFKEPDGDCDMSYTRVILTDCFMLVDIDVYDNGYIYIVSDEGQYSFYIGEKAARNLMYDARVKGVKTK